MAKKFPSSIPFASLLIYAPRGKSEISQKAKNACYAIKNGREDVVKAAVSRLAQAYVEAGMGDFFGRDVIVVPAPRSAPLVQGALWPAEIIAREIVRQGLARAVEPVLQRISAVPKSSFSKPGERPNVEKHLGSMKVDTMPVGGNRIVVVDDVLTKGRTLYAGATLMQEALPKATVRAFGLVRTMGFLDDVERVVDPCTGTLKYFFGEVHREP